MALPFLEPESDIHVNLATVIIIVESLCQTKRGKLTLNNGKLHTYLYLVQNPVACNHFLNSLGKSSVMLDYQDTFSVNTLAPNFDALFDRESVKALLTILVANKLLQVIYKKKDGFFYKLTSLGEEAAAKFTDDYFYNIRLMCQSLYDVQSLSENKINQTVSQVIKNGI